MKTIQYSIAAFSILLLLSSAPAQSMARVSGWAQSARNAAGTTAQKVWAHVPSKESVSNLAQSARNVAGTTAQNIWAHVPSKQDVVAKLPAMPSVPAAVKNIHMPEMHMPKVQVPEAVTNAVTQTLAYVPSREQIAQKAMNAVAIAQQHPRITAAAVATPFAIAGGVYVAKKALQKAPATRSVKAIVAANYEQAEIAFDEFRLMVSQVRAALRATLGKNRVPGSLNFKENLSEYEGKCLLPELQTAWNNFVREAIAYDNDESEARLELVKSTYNTVITELRTLHAIIKETAPVAAVSLKNRLAQYIPSMPSKKAVALTTAAVAVPATVGVAVKTGLAGKALQYVKNVDVKGMAKAAQAGVANAYQATRPVVGNAINQGITLAQNHKGALKVAAGAATVGAGLYGLHHYLNNEEAFTPDELVAQDDQIDQDEQDSKLMLGDQIGN